MFAFSTKLSLAKSLTIQWEVPEKIHYRKLQDFPELSNQYFFSFHQDFQSIHSWNSIGFICDNHAQNYKKGYWAVSKIGSKSNTSDHHSCYSISPHWLFLDLSHLLCVFAALYHVFFTGICQDTYWKLGVVSKFRL